MAIKKNELYFSLLKQGLMQWLLTGFIRLPQEA
ncbi:hypothetical protein WP8W19C03_19130 [Aeromonas veronii]|nr:hypothetical protein WP8W19C03_19130 [Aeromonas veronii]